MMFCAVISVPLLMFSVSFCTCHMGYSSFLFFPLECEYILKGKGLLCTVSKYANNVNISIHLYSCWGLS